MLHQTSPRLLGLLFAEPHGALVLRSYLHDLLQVIESLVESTDDIVTRRFSRADQDSSMHIHVGNNPPAFGAIDSPSAAPFHRLVAAACAAIVPASRSPSYSSMSSEETIPPPYSPSTTPINAGPYVHPPHVVLSGSSSASESGLFAWAEAAPAACGAHDQPPTPYPSPTHQ